MNNLTEAYNPNQSKNSSLLNSRTSKNMNLMEAVETYKNQQAPPRHVLIPFTLDAITEKDVIQEINDRNSVISIANSEDTMKVLGEGDLDGYKDERKNHRISGQEEKHFQQFISPKDLNIKKIHNIFGRIKICKEKFMEEFSEHKRLTKNILENIMNDRPYLKEKFDRLTNDLYISKKTRKKMDQINYFTRIKDCQQSCDIIKKYVAIGWTHQKRYTEFTEDIIKAKEVYVNLEGKHRKWEYEIIKTIFREFLDKELKLIENLKLKNNQISFDEDCVEYQNLQQNGKSPMNSEDNSQMYGWFQQATVGDCNVSRPEMSETDERMKWNAWNKIKGMEKETAMKNYTDLFNKYNRKVKLQFG